MTDPQLPSGWFPDPLERYDHRWFNGTTWTSDVSANGQRFVDPLGTAPPQPAESGNRAATAAMVCGLIGVAVAWVPFIVIAGIALGIIALVFGVKGLRRSRETGIGRRAAITGVITGGTALVLSILGIVLSVAVVRELVDYIDPGPHDVSVSGCEVDGRDVLVTGTITNRDGKRHDYTVFVEVGDRTVYDIIDAVDPGEQVEWVVDLRTTRQIDRCTPDIIVNGPFPWGIETDPVET